jgi:beta-lactamase regulating signal transducer with metallopeptidase domain/peroxiredoxin
MNAPPFFNWLLRTSWQASILVVLVLAVQWLFRRRLSAGWQYALWFLVVVRLALPSMPASSWSLFNVVHYAAATPAPPRTDAEAARPAMPIAPPASSLSVPGSVTEAPHLPRFLERKRAELSPAAAPAWSDKQRLMRNAAIVWLAGLLLLGGRAVGQNFVFMRRLRNAKAETNAGTLALFARCKEVMGVSKTVRLAETGHVKSPALYGFFHPTLLLPVNVMGQFSPTEQYHIFLHELAHVKRRDMAMHWVATVFRLLHWFNPVLWFGFQRMAADRELACDELALAGAGEKESRSYGETVLKLLQICARPAVLPCSLGILEEKSQMTRRILMIARYKQQARWPIVALLLMIGLGLITLTDAQSEKRKTEPAAATNSVSEIDKQVALIVDDWESLSGVFDDIDVYSAQIRDLVQIGKPAVPALAAALDRTERDVPMRLLGFTLRAIGDARGVPALIRALPKTLRPPGSDYGISVQGADLLAFMQKNDLEEGKNERGFGMGRPVREIGGALRKITGTQLNESGLYFTFLDGGEQQRAMERKIFHDSAQRWADWWKTNWNQFVDDPTLADVHLPALPEKPEPGRFLTGANMKVSEGTDGWVVGAFEEKAGNCCVDLNLGRTPQLPEAFSKTNGPAVSAEIMSAWAARAGADLLGTQYRDSVSGKLYYCLRGIGLQAWEVLNERWDSIAEEIHSNAPLALGSPAGDLLMHYDEDQARYMPERKATFLFLTRAGTQGILRVVAQSRPWTKADLGMPMMARTDTSPNQTEEAGPGRGVKLDYKFFFAQAEDIRAQEQQGAAAVEARQKRKTAAALDKYPHLTGIVYLPGGQPATNATVVLGAKGQGPILGDRRFELEDRLTIANTLADGSFSLPQLPGAYAICVAHDAGFSELDLDEAKPPFSIVLAPWGRIEGTVTLEGKPAPRQKMALLGPFWDSDHVSLSAGFFTAKSDEQGRFVFSNVPPREVQVCRMVHDTYYGGQFVTVAAGKTTVFEHGFHGRLLKGRLLTSDSSPDVHWNSGWGFNLSTKTEPPPPPPKGEDSRSWSQHYWSSPEGKARQRASRSFGLVVETNGDFTIDDVPGGSYELRIELHEGSGGPSWWMGKVLGRLTQDVGVPESSAAQESQPLDLGTLTVQMIKHFKPGDVAPDFQVKTIDGGSLQLADFRGKYVLLDFWATWCAPCRGETPNLKEVYDSFGANPQFAMIGLSLDKAADAPRDYAKANDTRWHQGFLGDWSQATLPARYGVEGIPSIFLIDPAGKIVATDLRGGDIKTAVSSALGENLLVPQ